MGALSTLKNERDTIATNIALLYKEELDRLGIDMICIKSDDIQIKRRIDIENGIIVYTLKGTLGNKINNPDVKIDIPLDLLRGLRRGVRAYDRHKKNIPNEPELEALVREYFVTLGLIKLWDKNGGAVKLEEDA